MNTPLNDTILAVSSPRGPGGIRAIIRLSGPVAWPAIRHLATLPPDAAVGWHDAHLRVMDAHLPAAVMLFRTPRSFTGEDLAELHVPNSAALLELLLQALLRHAAQQNLPLRLAEPGEFTARAFFNAKVDLTQAEGIAATINAANQTQLRAAAALRSGDLFRWTHTTADQLAHLLALVEAGIDFADEEDIRFVEAPQLRTTLAQLQTEIERQLSASRRLARRDQPPTVVFVGLPNVGKSSLINALAQRDRSIVSPIAGTTRDTLATLLHTPQGDIRLLDVPGEEPPSDTLREKMMATRQNALLQADLIVEVLAPDSPPAQTTPTFETPHIVIINKVDLLSSPPEAPNHLAPSAAADTHSSIVRPKGANYSSRGQAPAPPPVTAHARKGDPGGVQPDLHVSHPSPTAPHDPNNPCLVSAKTNHHIPELRTHLTNLLFHTPTAGGAWGGGREGHLELNERHRTLLHNALAALKQAALLVDQGATATHPELLAAELRRTLDLLGQITGTISPDEVLGRIFSQFCLGK